jgi:hypothetical protein
VPPHVEVALLRKHLRLTRAREAAAAVQQANVACAAMTAPPGVVLLDGFPADLAQAQVYTM